MAKEVKLELKERWPQGVRLPVLLTFEHQSGEAAPNRPGDRPNANYYGQMEYGARRGIWHILELLERFGIRGTFFVSGQTAEKFPDAVRAAHEAGHEIAGMGYAFEKVRTASREREQAIVRRTVKVLSETSGAAIKGWRVPDYRISPQTFDVLAAEGFRWDSTMLNDDLPYRLDCQHGALIEIPFTTSTTDKSYVAFPYPMRGGPSGMASAWHNEFDVLYAESDRVPRFFMLSLTTWASGRPTPLRMLRKFLERITAHNDIKFARCSDFAEWCDGAAVSNT
ncbi:MAG TPA: polysaccharide deacetylase family protein [Hyphomicrobiaceae bacterium]|nr:polysaccharide deacetylase family protein [Hyphomicrobiaceae bacterium]